MKWKTALAVFSTRLAKKKLLLSRMHHAKRKGGVTPMGCAKEVKKFRQFPGAGEGRETPNEPQRPKKEGPGHPRKQEPISQSVT